MPRSGLRLRAIKCRNDQLRILPSLELNMPISPSAKFTGNNDCSKIGRERQGLPNKIGRPMSVPADTCETF